MMGGNYWLNQVILDEIVQGLGKVLEKFIGVPYQSENDLIAELSDARDLFFIKNGYLKFSTFIKITFGISRQKGAQWSYEVEIIEIIKLV